MKLLPTICAAMLMSIGTAGAQNAQLVKIHFPTPIVAGVTEMPADAATIQVLNVGVTPTILIRSESGAQATLLVNRITRAASPDAAFASVQLEHKGDSFVMDEVWISETQGFQVIR